MSTSSRSWASSGAPLLVILAFVLGADGILVTFHIAERTVDSDYFMLFWASVVVALAPMTYLGLRRSTRDRNHVLLLGGIGFFTFLPKLFLDPNGPSYFDEYGHYRNALDIIRTNSSFPSSSYLPIEKYFPGLGGLTDLLHAVTRLSVWHSGLVVVGVSHCASLVVVYALAKSLGMVSRPAFLAAVVFGLNPSFMYFDSQYSYESLGLTLALVAILAMVRARQTGSVRWIAAGIAAALACTVTHHVASVVMAASCLLLAFVVPSERWGGRQAGVVAGWIVAAVAVIAPIIWLTAFATPTYDYLAPLLRSGFQEVPTALGITHQSATAGTTGESVRHGLFVGSNEPFYEKACGFLAPVLALGLTMAVLLSYLRRSVALPPRLLLVFPLLLSLLYFASLPLTVTAAGGEAAHRSWAYSYIGVGLIAGAALAVYEWASRDWVASRRRLAGVVLGVSLAVMLIGNVASGEDIQYRFPGPYLFGSDTRSDSNYLNSVIGWLQANGTAGAGVVCDRATGEYVAAYTKLNVPKPSQFQVYRLYSQGDAPTPALRTALQRGHFEYFVLNTQIETETPAAPFFEGYSPKQVNASVLAQMGSTAFAAVVYRTGPYIVYQLHP